MKTSGILTAILLLHLTYSFGQDTIVPTNEEEKVSRFQIGINYCPAFAYRHLQNTTGNPDIDQTITSSNEDDITKYGFSSGIHFRYTITKYFALSVGVEFSDKGYQTRSIQYLSVEPNGVITDNGTFHYKYSYQYIAVPIKQSFTFGRNKKLRYIASAGLVTNFLVGGYHKTFIQYSNSGKKVTKFNLSDDYNKVMLSSQVSFGFDYALNDRINMHIESCYGFGLTAINTTPLTARLVDVGLNVGCFVRL